MMRIPSGIAAEQRLSDGVIAHVRHFRPVGVPQGYVVGLHGIQSHSGWYGRSSQLLAEAGFDVRLVDRRGSGLSEGARGHALESTRLISDVITHLQAVGAERDMISPAAPVVLMGISWGGRLAAAVAAERPECLDGLVLLAPGIYSRMDPGLPQRLALRLARLAGIRNRTFPIPLGNPALFTDDPAWQHYIAFDPLSLRRVSVGFLNAGEELRKRAESGAGQIHCPTLLVLAGRDRIVDNPPTCAWFDRLASGNKTLVDFPTAVHTHEFDACFEEFLKTLRGWLKSLSAGHVPVRRSA
jgi:alpha-beta hydrolase superfamily lysophospholipase